MAIYKMSQSITILPIDDAFLGMCLQKAGLGIKSHIGVHCQGLHIPSNDAHDPCFYKELILVHRFVVHQIYIMWHAVRDSHLKCVGKTLTL